MTEDVDVTEAPPPGWDARVVEAPGGHVYQSTAWAEHRRAGGWQPLFATTSAGASVLALTRPWPLLGGASAYVPRGPVMSAEGAATARALVAVTRALAGRGVDVVAADPEVPAADGTYGDRIRAAGFRPIDEIQPSRHRIALPLPPGADEAAAFANLAKSTRQRVRKAEAGLRVVRFDARLAAGTTGDGAGEGFAPSDDDAAVALGRFYDLLRETGDRRGFGFGPRDEFVSWWKRAHAAGLLVYLEAWGAAGSGELVAGLVLYRHGGRFTTVHSGDRVATRREHPGALHLLRWRAIQLAVREGCSELDLGGVDVPGARREPREGEPMWGLYQHKLSFGGRWLALTGAHERVIRPRRYAAGRLVSAMLRRAGPVGRLAGLR